MTTRNDSTCRTQAKGHATVGNTQHDTGLQNGTQKAKQDMLQNAKQRQCNGPNTWKHSIEMKQRDSTSLSLIEATKQKM
jgi:hypothetical protein